MPSAATHTRTAGNPVPLRQDAAIIGMVDLSPHKSQFPAPDPAVMFPVFIKEFGFSFPSWAC